MGQKVIRLKGFCKVGEKPPAFEGAKGPASDGRSLPLDEAQAVADRFGTPLSPLYGESDIGVETKS